MSKFLYLLPAHFLERFGPFLLPFAMASPRYLRQVRARKLLAEEMALVPLHETIAQARDPAYTMDHKERLQGRFLGDLLG